MNLPCVFRPRFPACGLLAAVLLTSASRGWSHEETRRASEAARDSRGAVILVAAADLRPPAAVAPVAVESCQLTLRLVDAGTGRPRSGLVRVTRDDGRVLPLAGLVNRGVGLRRGHPAKEWNVVTRTVTVAVPRGVLNLEAVSGLETERARLTMDLTGKAAAQFDVPLRSFYSAVRNGWFAGNTHLHLDGGGKRGEGELSRAQADEYLRELPRGDGLDLVFVSYLERPSEDRRYVSNEYTLADLQRLGGRDLVFGNGQEHRHNFSGVNEGYGHVMFLNIRELTRPVSIGPGITDRGPDWPPLRAGISRIRRQGATIVWCHNSLGYEDVPSWLGGLVDAQNIFDGGSAGSYDSSFYRYLNIGLKVPFSSGTDWFIYDFSRVYARLGGELTTQAWLEALRAGRTFISNGPLLDFDVGGKMAGDTIQLSGPGELTITGSAKGRHDFHALELVRNGQVVHRVTSRAVGGHYEAEFEHRLTVPEPGWLALRVSGGSLDTDGAVAVPAALPVRGTGPKNEMGETPFAHTSPIYLEMGGKTIFQRDAAESLVGDMETALAKIPVAGVFDHAAQREEVLQVYRDGIAALRRRLD